MARLPSPSVAFLISTAILCAEGFLHHQSSFLRRSPQLTHPQTPPQRDDGDAGTPLFLTPLIEAGRAKEGKDLARVTLTESLGIKSYAGFFTVNKTYDSNQFFWYFPAMASDANTTDYPVVVWLQGGPGVSSLYGLFTENGPLTVSNNEFKKRQFTWASNHHMIYIDNPVGAGFSFTRNERGYCTDQSQVGEQLYSSITQFFQLFPELQENKFFISGESYAGKYIPAFASTIHRKNPTAALKVNLKGVAIGNGYSDPAHQLGYGKYLSQIGLIDWNQAEELEGYENKTQNYIRQQEWDNATETCYSMWFSISMWTCVNIYNYLKTNKLGVHDYELMLQKSAVREAIHVGNLTYNLSKHDVYRYLLEDVMKSVAPLISELLDHYTVAVYNGQLDVSEAYPLTVNYLRNLNFSAAEDYKTAPRHKWKVGGDVAGYVKRAGNLVEILVRDAGHMVPADQPEWSLDMISRITRDGFQNPEKPYLLY